MTDKDDKFIMMDMNDKRSKKVAEVLGNKTCKAMLDYLTYNSEKSEEDIAKALDMKLNTVEYNLKKLLDSGLIHKTKKFFWSKKGKKIPTYSLANKHIVISPKHTRPNLSVLKTILPIIAAVAILVIVLALIIPSSNNRGQVEEVEGLQNFKSMQELEAFLEQNQNTGNLFGSVSLERDAVFATPAMAAQENAGAEDTKSSAHDYSETNIQVKGVDEADIVKNNGKSIFTISGNKVIIINAYPAESMEIASEINITNPINLFINENKLVIFSQKYSGTQETIISIFDVSNAENPELENEIILDGYYVDSRMINDYVYLISNKYTSLQNLALPGFSVEGVRSEVAVTDIGYLPYPDSGYTFTNIMAVNLNTGNHNLETYLLGSNHNIFVSKNNIYITQIKRITSENYFNEFLDQVIYSLVPSDINDEIKKIMDSDGSFYEKQLQVVEIIEDYSSRLKGKEKSTFDTQLMEEIEDFSIYLQKKQEITTIHKISIDQENIDYVTNGAVPGTTLNQFSMDEYDGYFRIATTTGNSWGSRDSSLNHLHVLDEDLENVGSVEDLAKGERIYSVRFMGSRAYVVTFRQVDPLFVLDLSNPENPEVLGQLKVTGYSSYLHPYDENHVIGIGKEATETGRVQGVKIALFDVSNVENPIEKAKYEVQGKWSDSNALYDHKAFLFDKQKELLVLPISYTVENDPAPGVREYNHWQGAFVFNINENDISLRGTIDHKEDNEDEEYYYGPYAVQRSLYMDNVLYTLSGTLVKANDLDSLYEINKVKLPYDYDHRVMVDGVGIILE